MVFVHCKFSEMGSEPREQGTGPEIGGMGSITKVMGLGLGPGGGTGGWEAGLGPSLVGSNLGSSRVSKAEAQPGGLKIKGLGLEPQGPGLG